MQGRTPPPSRTPPGAQQGQRVAPPSRNVAGSPQRASAGPQQQQGVQYQQQGAQYQQQVQQGAQYQQQVPVQQGVQYQQQQPVQYQQQQQGVQYQQQAAYQQQVQYQQQQQQAGYPQQGVQYQQQVAYQVQQQQAAYQQQLLFQQQQQQLLQQQQAQQNLNPEERIVKITEELTKIQAQIQAVQQKQAQLQASTDQFEKKLLHVSYFPQNYPAGYEQQLNAQKQQVLAAIQKLNESLFQLNAGEKKCTQAIENIKLQQQQQQELERQQAQQRRLEQAMSLTFQYNPQSEEQVMIPDYVIQQIDADIRKFGIEPESYGVFDKIQYLLSSTDTQTKDKHLRTILHLSTDVQNQSIILQTRVVPAITNLVATNESKAIVKNVIWLYSNLANIEKNKHSICRSGIIPYVTALLMDSDDNMVNQILELLARVLCNEVYREIFHAANGLAYILELLKEGSQQQKVLSLELMSVVGFSDESQAQIFLKSGVVSNIIQLINSPKTQTQQKNVAIRALVSLSSVVSSAIISAGGVDAIASQLLTDDKEYLIEILNTLISMSSNSLAKSMLCDGSSFDHLLKLLSSQESELAVLSAKLFTEILYKENYKHKFERKGGLKLVHAMLNAPDIDSCLASIKLLSVVGFPSESAQQDFLSDKSLEIMIKLFSSNDLSISASAVITISKFSDKHLKTFLDKGIIPQLIKLLSYTDITVLEKSISLLHKLITTVPQSISIISKEGAINQLFKFITHADERISLKTLHCIESICKSTNNFEPFKSSNFQTLIVQQLQSTNEVLKRTALSIVASLSKQSASIQGGFGENGVIHSIAKISQIGSLDSLTECLKYLSKHPRNQEKIIETGLLSTLLRHVRTKNYQLLSSIYTVIYNITTNNQYACSLVATKIEDFINIVLGLAKVQENTTASINDTILYAINIFSNLATIELGRRVLKRKTELLDTLKNMRNSKSQSFSQAADNALILIGYPVDDFDINSPENQQAIGVIAGTEPIGHDYLTSLQAPLQQVKLFERIKQQIQSLSKKFVTNSDKDNSSQLEDQIQDYKKKLQESEENLQQMKIDCDSLENQLQFISNDIRRLKEGLLELQEQNDEMLQMEIEQKIEELQVREKLYTDTQKLISDTRVQLEQDRMKFDKDSASIDKEIETLTNQLKASNGASNIDENTKNAISHEKRIFILSQLLANQKEFLQRIRELVEGYVFSISLSINQAQNHPLAPFTQQIIEIYRSHLILTELIEKRIRSYHDKLKFGDIFTKFVDFLSVHAKFSKDYDKYNLYLSNIRRNDAATAEVINEVYVSNQLLSLPSYMMLIMHQIPWCSFLVSCLLKATTSSSFDNRFLRNAARKWAELSDMVERGEDMSGNAKATLGVEERYRDLVTLISEHGFEFLDTFGELSESESVLPNIIRYFASQGLSMKFLNHQISREVTETVGESTLFRSNNLPAQCLSAFAHNVGVDYLQNAIKPFLLKFFTENDSLEVNEALLGVPADDPIVLNNQAKLIKTCEDAFNFISGTISQCPSNLRSVCASLRQLVGQRFPENSIISVGGLFFLRFVCPCFVTPERFKLIAVTDIDKVRRRNGILVSKVLQGLSNNVPFGKKEPFMIPINDFITRYQPKMNALLLRLSSHSDSIEKSTGFVSEADLFEIHSSFFNMKDPLAKKLVESGNDELKDRFTKIMNAMGEPKEPGLEDDPSSVSKATKVITSN